MPIASGAPIISAITCCFKNCVDKIIKIAQMDIIIATTLYFFFVNHTDAVSADVPQCKLGKQLNSH